jgi:hypothetical protein
MDYLFLFSPSKGFWSKTDSWTYISNDVQLIKQRVRLQVNFRNTPDTRLVELSTCQNLSLKQIAHITFELFFLRSSIDNTNFTILKAAYPDIVNVGKSDEATWVKNKVDSLVLGRTQIKALVDTLDRDSDFYVTTGFMGQSFFLIPKNESQKVEKAPLLAPRITEKKFQNRRRSYYSR